MTEYLFVREEDITSIVNAAIAALNLGSAAYEDVGFFATAAQGALADSALQDVVDDVSPQLGGNLDFNGFYATGGYFYGNAGALTASLNVVNAGTDGGVFGRVANFKYLSPTPAVNDQALLSLYQYNNAGTPEEIEYGRVSARIRSLTDGSESGELLLGNIESGTFGARVAVRGFDFSPVASDAVALGRSDSFWSDLFLGSGGVINWNNGDVLITHSANALVFSGASGGYFYDAGVSMAGEVHASGANGAFVLHRRDTDATVWFMYSAAGNLQWYDAVGATDRLFLNASTIGPALNDGLSLGAATLAFSDLFLASGAVINWANGDMTLTHASNQLTLAGGYINLGLSDYADDTAASAGGVPIGSLYHNSGAVRVRVA